MLSKLWQTWLILRFVRQAFPVVDRELSGWQSKAKDIPDERLKEQALASLRAKRFHAQGGAVYGLYPSLNKTARLEVLRFIVAYQTISDYLDNLCDRAGVEEARAFRQLHIAMDEALTPGKSLSDYYCYYPYKEDGGYLAGLVKVCQNALACPELAAVQPALRRFAERYANLQTYKHLNITQRDAAMRQWLEPLVQEYPGFTPWELAAASGSTLAIFYFAALAKANGANAFLPEAESVYFPWVNALHILLDYFIDRQEDQANGDLNLVTDYASDAHMAERMIFIYQMSRQAVAKLPYPDFHLAVIDGLLAMYLSDPKALADINKQTAEALLAAGGWYPRFLLRLITRLRRQKII